MNTDEYLPPSNTLNIDAMRRLFNKTTNSYKFLFFISLLDILARKKFCVTEPITFEALTIEMLANAWFPHTFFNLSFGTQDTITKKLDALPLNIGEPIVRFLDRDKELLREIIASVDLDQSIRLMEFVPFRLLSPFLEEELKDTDKGEWMVFETAMPAIANRHFYTKNPLYRFDSDKYKECSGIYVNPLWADYLQTHFSSIYDWASWHWLKYMQKRNPSTENLIGKLFMPSR